jgi:hypothetical protein
MNAQGPRVRRTGASGVLRVIGERERNASRARARPPGPAFEGSSASALMPGGQAAPRAPTCASAQTRAEAAIMVNGKVQQRFAKGRIQCRHHGSSSQFARTPRRGSRGGGGKSGGACRWRARPSTTTSTVSWTLVPTVISGRCRRGPERLSSTCRSIRLRGIRISASRPGLALGRCRDALCGCVAPSWAYRPYERDRESVSSFARNYRFIDEKSRRPMAPGVAQ